MAALALAVGLCCVATVMVAEQARREARVVLENEDKVCAVAITSPPPPSPSLSV